jgi:hypothetical protein
MASVEKKKGVAQRKSDEPVMNRLSVVLELLDPYSASETGPLLSPVLATDGECTHLACIQIHLGHLATNAFVAYYCVYLICVHLHHSV